MELIARTCFGKNSFIIISLACVFILVTSSYCLAEQTIQHPIDQFEEEQIEKDWSTAGMVNATVEATNKWEVEMNKYYELLKQELRSSEKEQLIKSQEAWLKFYREEVKNITNVFAQLTGTIYITMRAANYRELVKIRAQDLKDYYELIKVNK
ncbi:MAG: DUF1311 domain-containing protein [Candidatus Omnitrophica bacterium]|nr:DUF1311 domain-containing protein [Candidatus Omnitrophota bacterium]